jgi:membrane-associated HD superfamily phosphohydrolase
LKTEPTEFDPLRKGNIIQQLRTKVRSEAAEKNQIAALSSSRNDSVSSISDSCTFTNYDSDYDSDNDGENAFQSLHETMNWKDGTVVSKEGSKSKISDEEMEILRYYFVEQFLEDYLS